MFVKVFVLTVVVAMASAANELSCKERLTGPVLTDITITWHTKADCPAGVDISVPFLSSKAGNAIIVKNIQLKNGSDVITNTDDDLFSIKVEQPMSGDDTKMELLMTCSSANMGFCLDRASQGQRSHISITSNATSDLSVYFTVQELPSDEFAGYQNCVCAGETSVTAHGETFIHVNLPGNDSTVWSSTAKPCLGSLCSYIISTDVDASIDIKFVNTETLTNKSYVQCQVLGRQYDVYNHKSIVAMPSFNISDYNTPIVTKIFSSSLLMYVYVEYYSYDTFVNASLLPQSAFTMNVSTPLVEEVVLATPIKFTTSSAKKQTISSPDRMMSYPTQVVQWEVSTTVEDKDNKKYEIGYSKVVCTNIVKGSNYMVVRDTCDGKILKQIDSCSDLSSTAVGTGEKNVCVSWIRENSTLDTGKWQISFNLIETSSAMSVSSTGFLLIVAVFALFIKQ
jgi:hypothetical protein